MNEIDNTSRTVSEESVIPRKEIDFQKEIIKRDEIIARLSSRLKESFSQNENHVLMQFEQVELLKQEIEKLQVELSQADEKLKAQEIHHLGSVQAIENVKGEVYSLQNCLQNVTILDPNSHTNTIPSSSSETHQCNSISSSNPNCVENSTEDLAYNLRELQQQLENLEEKRLKDLRMQEAELMVKYEEELAQHKRDLEVRFIQKSEAENARKQREFIKAFQKMKKNMKKTTNHKNDENNLAKENEKLPEKKESDIVQKLALENQELAEVRDILLQQVDISQENQDILKKELDTYLCQDQTTSSDDDIFMDEIERISKIQTDGAMMEWEILSPSGVVNRENTQTSLGFFEDTIDERQLMSELVTNAGPVSQCQNIDCINMRNRLQELLKTNVSQNSLSNGVFCDDGDDPPKVRNENMSDNLSESESGSHFCLSDEFASSDLIPHLKQFKQIKADLEQKIEHQFHVFAEEKNNFSKICDALKIQVENLLLAKSQLEEELEGKNAALLTLSEEFQNTLEKFEFSKDDLHQHLHLLQTEQADISVNNKTPEHSSTKTADAGSFVREEDFTSMDMILEPNIEPGDIEFWDTNFNAQNFKTQVINKPSQIYEVDPELQLQGYSKEQTIEYITELEEKERIIDDLVLQVNSLERQLKSSKQFLSEQSADREVERDEASKEINRLNKLIDEKDSQLTSNKNLYQEIGDMKDRIESLQEDVESLNSENQQLKTQLNTSTQRNSDLENNIKLLEDELNEKTLEEGNLPQEVVSQESPTPSSSESNDLGMLYSESDSNPVPHKKQKCDSEKSYDTIDTEIKMKLLEDEVISLKLKLRQEKLIGADLLRSLVAEQKRYNILLNKEKIESDSCTTELLDQWVHVSKLQNALKEEQEYCSSILDVLEEQQVRFNKVKMKLKQEEEHRFILEQRLTDAKINLRQQVPVQPDTRQQMAKVQRLYARYLRAESYRKALIYQKKYLLILIGGYQDTEQATLGMIAQTGVPITYSINRYPYYTPLLHIFRRTVTAVIAIFRMKYMVTKWKRAVKVGSPVVGGAASVGYGYLTSHSSCSQESLRLL
ncbi:hypothetical protein SNE40_023022 [Patella caerulea]|uniref:Pericentrin/AKAP-450 centrosomal targeting domain-containing protein n=1 Tax=Patella caerulea TaxID=87958 RepID=A0AAN8G1X5_PATCE